MKKPIIIDNKRFSRVKKLLKKNLENNNLSLSLSESGEILAKALGFTDYHHIEQFLKKIYCHHIIQRKYTLNIFILFLKICWTISIIVKTILLIIHKK